MDRSSWKYPLFKAWTRGVIEDSNWLFTHKRFSFHSELWAWLCSAWVKWSLLTGLHHHLCPVRCMSISSERRGCSHTITDTKVLKRTFSIVCFSPQFSSTPKSYNVLETLCDCKVCKYNYFFLIHCISGRRVTTFLLVDSLVAPVWWSNLWLTRKSYHLFELRLSES